MGLSLDGGAPRPPEPVERRTHESYTQNAAHQSLASGPKHTSAADTAVDAAGKAEDLFGVVLDDEQAVFRVFRGAEERVGLTGSVIRLVDGQASAGVGVVLVAFRTGGEGRQLARRRTDQKGRFSFDVLISKDVVLGYHRLQVVIVADE